MTVKKPLPYGTAVLFVFWGVLLALVFYWMLPGKEVPPELRGVLRYEPKALQAFELVDQHNQPFTQERLKGTWSFVFFGYTYCPDICPTTLATLSSVFGKLKSDAQGIANEQVVFVSVDPERDRPEVLAEYVKYFSPEFLGVTGGKSDIDRLVRQFGASYIKEDPVRTGEYLISHASTIFLVDPRMQLRAYFAPPHDPATIIEQYRQIRSLY